MVANTGDKYTGQVIPDAKGNPTTLGINSQIQQLWDAVHRLEGRTGTSANLSNGTFVGQVTTGGRVGVEESTPLGSLHVTTETVYPSSSPQAEPISNTLGYPCTLLLEVNENTVSNPNNNQVIQPYPTIGFIRTHPNTGNPTEQLGYIQFLPGGIFQINGAPITTYPAFFLSSTSSSGIAVYTTSFSNSNYTLSGSPTGSSITIGTTGNYLINVFAKGSATNAGAALIIQHNGSNVGTSSIFASTTATAQGFTISNFFMGSFSSGDTITIVLSDWNSYSGGALSIQSVQ